MPQSSWLSSRRGPKPRLFSRAQGFNDDRDVCIRRLAACAPGVAKRQVLRHTCRSRTISAGRLEPFNGGRRAVAAEWKTDLASDITSKWSGLVVSSSLVLEYRNSILTGGVRSLLHHAKEIVVGILQDHEVIPGLVSPGVADRAERHEPLHFSSTIFRIEIEMQPASFAHTTFGALIQG